MPLMKCKGYPHEPGSLNEGVLHPAARFAAHSHQQQRVIMQRPLIAFLAAGVLFGSLSGCAGMDKSTGIGAALGGLAGSQVGGGKGRYVGVAAGIAVGAFIGNRVGKYLDEKEKRKAADATAQTAETGQKQEFKTTSGATVTTVAAAAPPPAATATPARECRTVRQSVVLENGTRDSEDVTVCKGPDGWQPA